MNIVGIASFFMRRKLFHRSSPMAFLIVPFFNLKGVKETGTPTGTVRRVSLPLFLKVSVTTKAPSLVCVENS